MEIPTRHGNPSLLRLSLAAALIFPSFTQARTIVLQPVKALLPVVKINGTGGATTGTVASSSSTGSLNLLHNANFAKLGAGALQLNATTTLAGNLQISVGGVLTLTGITTDVAFSPGSLLRTSNGVNLTIAGLTLASPTLTSASAGTLTINGNSNLSPNVGTAGTVSLNPGNLTITSGSFTLGNSASPPFLLQSAGSSGNGAPAPVPEPTTAMLASLGLGLIAARRWRR